VTVPRQDRGTDEPRRGAARVRLAALMYAVAAAVVLADRLTKLWARNTLPGRAPITLVPGVLDLSFTTNSGGAFGLFGGAAWLFFGATIVVCAVIVYASLALPGRLAAVGLGLVLAGAVGNLIDRIFNRGQLSGRVVDFIHLHRWPVFNVADSAIVVGVVILLVSTLLRSRSRS
jgi:signal peptidase II